MLTDSKPFENKHMCWPNLRDVNQIAATCINVCSIRGHAQNKSIRCARDSYNSFTLDILEILGGKYSLSFP